MHLININFMGASICVMHFSTSNGLTIGRRNKATPRCTALVTAKTRKQKKVVSSRGSQRGPRESRTKSDSGASVRGVHIKRCHPGRRYFMGPPFVLTPVRHSKFAKVGFQFLLANVDGGTHEEGYAGSQIQSHLPRSFPCAEELLVNSSKR